MLFVLGVNSFRTLLDEKASQLSLLEVPRIASHEFGLRGLVLSTEFLAGADERRLDAIRAAGDKAGCPSLVLVEAQTQRLHTDPEEDDGVVTHRMARVLRAAHRLGCSSVGMSLEAAPGDNARPLLVQRLRHLADEAERMQINILIRCVHDVFATPEDVTELLKQVGGFRIGSMPDFSNAAQAEEPVAYLRRLAPYAACVTATSHKFTPKGRHEPYDIDPFIGTLRDMNYEGIVSIEYLGNGDPMQGVRQTVEAVVPPQERGEE